MSSEEPLGKYPTLGIVAVVAVVGLVVLGMGINNGGITGLAAGGQGKAKGNVCMKECMGINAEYFDAQNSLTQYCLTQCNPSVENSQCEAHADGCCKPFSGDPDCTGAGSGTDPCADDGICNPACTGTDPDCVVECIAFTPEQVAYWSQWALNQGYTVNLAQSYYTQCSYQDGGDVGSFYVGNWAEGRVSVNGTLVYKRQDPDITPERAAVCKAVLEENCMTS